MSSRIVVVVGTRPEAIKLAPTVLALRAARHFDPVVVVTGQHREMLDDVLDVFGIRPDHDLALIRDRQTLTHVTVAVLEGLERILEVEEPDLVVVQGDTTTTFAASLAAFYRRIPVAHVEAGLRSGDRWSPYPEEMNRRLTSRLAAFHLCPTPLAAANLHAEAVDPVRTVVTGNSAIDALQYVVATLPRTVSGDHEGRTILVTAHRRESWESGLASIARAVRRVVEARSDVRVVFPIHPNPVVREAMLPILGGLPSVDVVEPMGYRDFVRTMAGAHIVLTDSGGIQEEAPTLGVPVLVTRANTERPEAVVQGTARVIGSDEDAIVLEVLRLLDDPEAHQTMSMATNPYGDGLASARTVEALRHFLSGAPRPCEFSPPPAPEGEACG